MRSNDAMKRTPKGFASRLADGFDGDALGEVARLVDVAAELDGEVVGEELAG